MFYRQLVGALLCSLEAGSSHCTKWPHGALYTKSAHTIDPHASPFNYVGINWPGERETTIPEGLQYSSITDIVMKIKSLDFDSVRMG